MTTQEELFKEFMASSEDTSKEFDQAFERAAKLCEIKIAIAEMERTQDPIGTKARQDALAEHRKKLADTTFKNKAQVKAQAHSGTAGSNTKGTRPDETLTQAMRGLFNHLLRNGEMDSLKKANILVFTNRMKALINQNATRKISKGDTEISEYLSERIEWVKNVGARPTIKTKQYNHPRKSGLFKPEKSIIYRKEYIEKRLERLRAEFSISD